MGQPVELPAAANGRRLARSVRGAGEIKLRLWTPKVAPNELCPSLAPFCQPHKESYSKWPLAVRRPGLSFKAELRRSSLARAVLQRSLLASGSSRSPQPRPAQEQFPPCSNVNIRRHKLLNTFVASVAAIAAAASDS